MAEALRFTFERPAAFDEKAVAPTTIPSGAMSVATISSASRATSA